MLCCALTSPRALVVKEDPVDREHVVGLSKVHHDPVSIELCGTCEERWRKTGAEETGCQMHISTRELKRYDFTQKLTVLSDPQSTLLSDMMLLFTPSVNKTLMQP